MNDQVKIDALYGTLQPRYEFIPMLVTPSYEQTDRLIVHIASRGMMLTSIGILMTFLTALMAFAGGYVGYSSYIPVIPLAFALHSLMMARHLRRQWAQQFVLHRIKS